MLAARKLHKRYGESVALHALDLEIGPGELYALLGPNGAGKTTTINCFLGFVAPDGGQALVGGVDPARDPAAARRALAYIPEQVNLYGWFSGLENLEYFAGLSGRRWSRDDLRSLLSDSGLQSEAWDRKVSGYSKGMRQKVGVAIALAKQARALLLDEPTSGLDPAASHEFGGLLRKMTERGVAILMATHDLHRAREVASRVGIIKSGRLVVDIDATSLTASQLERLYLESMGAAASS